MQVSKNTMVIELATNYYIAFATFQGLCRQHPQKEFSFIKLVQFAIRGCDK